MRRKRPDKRAAKNFQFHHDNAPSYSTHVIQAFLAKNDMPLVRQAPYSPGSAPCDFWLFPQVETTLKASLFQSRENMRKLTEKLQSILEEEFKSCFQKWQKSLEKCMDLQGKYFEGD